MCTHIMSIQFDVKTRCDSRLRDFSCSNRSNILSALLTSKSYHVLLSYSRTSNNLCVLGPVRKPNFIFVGRYQTSMSILSPARPLLFGIGSHGLMPSAPAKPDCQSLRLQTYLCWEQAVPDMLALQVVNQIG
jgi:hypothetical protein